MRKPLSFILLPLWVAILVPPETVSQVASVSVDRYSFVNAYAASMGDANVALVHDAGGMYCNPASLSFLQGTQVSIIGALVTSFEQARLFSTNAVASTRLTQSFSLGAGGSHHWTDKLPKDSTGNSSWFESYGMDVGISCLLSPAWSVGILASGRQGMMRSVPGNSSAFFFSYGFYYNPSPGIQYGFVHQGIGSVITYPYDSWPTVRPTERKRSAGSVQFGLSTTFPASLGPPSVVLSIASQKLIGVDGFVYKGGIEWWAHRFIAFRLGYWAGPVTVAAKYGAGLKLDWLMVDYALSASDAEPRYHQLTITTVL